MWWPFGKKKIEESKPQEKANEAEFNRDIKALLEREDIQCRDDVCEAEFAKAMKLLSNPTKEQLMRAYDLMGNLASKFEYVPAILWMGDCAENMKKRPQEAVYWYKKAADLGDGNGARCYADMLMTGKGCNADMMQAMKYYAIAADEGVPEAAFVLGEFLRNNGDKENALKAYRQALAGGYIPAQNRINNMNA